MAPNSAVKPAPTWAANATPAMSGVTSRVLAHDDTRPVNDCAPSCSSPLNPWSPTSVPVKNDIEKITNTMPPPTISAPAPIVMSLMMSKTTPMRLGRSACGTSRSTRIEKPIWRPTSSKASPIALPD